MAISEKGYEQLVPINPNQLKQVKVTECPRTHLYHGDKRAADQGAL